MQLLWESYEMRSYWSKKNISWQRRAMLLLAPRLQKNVRKELWKLYKEKADNFPINPRYIAINNNHESEDEVEISTTSNDKRRNSSGRKGLMDMFCRNSPTAIEKKKKEKLRQDNIKIGM